MYAPENHMSGQNWTCRIRHRLLNWNEHPQTSSPRFR